MTEQKDEKLLGNQLVKDFITLHGGRDELHEILLQQSRISFQEGVEAERERVDDLFCEWCMENEFVDESEAQNFRKLLTPPTNEEKQ